MLTLFLLSLLLVSNPCSQAASTSQPENDQVTKTRENKEPERNLHPVTFPALFGLTVSLKSPVHHQGETLPARSDNITKTESITARTREEREPEKNLHHVTFPALFGQRKTFPSISDNIAKTESVTALTPPVTEEFHTTPSTKPYIIAKEIFAIPVQLEPDTLPPAHVIFLSTSLTGPFRHVHATEHVCGPKGACDTRPGPWTCESIGFRCHTCRCDEDCFRFGDCCPDKYNLTDFQPSAELDTCFSAVIKSSEAIPDQRYLLVDKCINQSSSGELTDKCEKYSSKTEPVYSPQTRHHYKNRFCALCNGVQETVSWPVKAICRAVLNYSELHTPEDFFLEAWQNPSCGLFAVPPEDSEARECSYDSSMVSECPADWADMSVVTDCHKYRYPVTVIGVKTYRNIFCAICNGISLMRMLDACDVLPIIITTNYPHSSVYDYHLAANSNTSVSDQCPDDQLFDTFQSKCRHLYCPPGKLVRGHSCVDMFSSASFTAYALCFTLRPVSDKGVLLYERSISTIFRQYLTDTSYIDEYADVSMEKTEINVTFSKLDDLPRDHMLEGFRVFNITVKRRLVFRRQVPNRQLERMLIDSVRQGWSFYNEPKESFEEFHAHWLSESTDEEFLTADVPTFSITNHLQTTTERRVLTKSPLAPLPADYHTTSSVYLPVNELMNCNLIELSPEEFKANGENSIVEKATGKVLVTGQYLPVGKAVRVCTDFTGNIVRQERHGKVHGGQVQRTINLPGKSETTITLTCTGLSLFFILLTFVCYAFNSGFRSLTSKSNMAFFVNLFCAQVSLLLSIVLPVSATACNVLGAIVHYFWLSTFSWALCSTYLAYMTVNKLYNPNNSSRMLTLFCLLSQCLPCMLVAAYIAVHVITSQTSGYGLTSISKNGHVCFLASSVDVIVGFVTPIGLLFLFSEIVLVRLLFTSPQKRKVLENDTELDRTFPRSYCTVLVAMACTWVFGNLAIIMVDAYLWHGFLLLHASVGLFVTYSFSPMASCCELKDKRYEPNTCLNDYTEKHVGEQTDESVNAYHSHM